MYTNLKSFLILILLAVCILGCDKKTGETQNTEKEESQTGRLAHTESIVFPPRTGKNDELAVTLEGAEFKLKISKETPLTFAGERELGPNQFIPIDGAFTITGGVLVSKLGSVEMRATFGAWSTIKNATGGIVGYGFDLTDGEVVLPNVFLSDPPSGLRVANSYEFEDLGEDYCIIKLDPRKEHRLTVQNIMKDGEGMFGSMRSNTNGKLSGTVLLVPQQQLHSLSEIDEVKSFLRMTASCIGTKVVSQSQTFERRNDGWYLGDVCVSQ